MAAIAAAPAATITELRLVSLRLRNFKGIREFTLEAGGQDLSIFADNGVGKTSIADAFLWLLFGKDSHNRKDFEIKTLEPDGKPIHFLEHEVEAVLSVNGREITLRRMLKEVWTRPRNQVNQEFGGHTTDYWINGVGVPQGQYQAAIRDICDENLFRLLTDPTYFNTQLTWQKRRELLLEVCGDVTDADVIASTSKLAELTTVLDGRTIDDRKKISEARRREVNKEIEELPTRISEARRLIPTISESKEQLEKAVADLRLVRTDLLQEWQRIRAGAEVTEKQRQITEIDTQVLKLKNAQAEALAMVSRSSQAALNDLRVKADTARRLVTNTQGEITDLKGRIARHEASLLTLRGQFNVIKAREFAPPAQVTICPSCQQDIPAERLDEVRQRAEEEFNLQRSKDLEANKAQGKGLAAELQGMNSDLETLQARLETERLDLETQTTQVQAEEQRLSAQPSAAPSPDPQIDELTRQRAAIQEQIDGLVRDSSEAAQSVQVKINSTDQSIRETEQKLAQFGVREQAEKRVAELTKRETDLATEAEKLEKELWLIEEFIRTKVSMLTDRINSKFQFVRFKLFNEQVNGGLEETCVCTVDGAPYDGALNHGGRINAGLSIINTLADHYQFAPCVFVDNAESVTALLPTVGQQIRLVVSAPDKTLRVESAEGNQ